MAQRFVPSYFLVTDYTQAEEDTLALTLIGTSNGSKVIYNTTLNKTRIWNGTAFQNFSVMDVDGGSYTAAPLTAIPNSIYRTILNCSGSHIAGRVAGTYAMGHGDPLAISGTGTLYPLNAIYIAASDYPTFISTSSLPPKLRIRAQLYTNDIAPTGNFTFGLYPITRPPTSGGAGLNIFTLGTVVTGSNGAIFTNPAPDGLYNAVGVDFALPVDGHYVIGIVTTATVATSAHIHLCAQLQIRNN